MNSEWKLNCIIKNEDTKFSSCWDIEHTLYLTINKNFEYHAQTKHIKKKYITEWASHRHLWVGWATTQKTHRSISIRAVQFMSLESGKYRKDKKKKVRKVS